MKTTDLSLLLSEYQQLTSWKDIYQWQRVNSKGNTEIISEWLIRDFNNFTWNFNGIRKNNFRIDDHHGFCSNQTDLSQLTEKRFCRALYNAYNIYQHPLLGLLLDYEIPLTEPKQATKENHGEIDLISKRDDEMLLIEAKISPSSESLLKAVLEIFFYITTLQHFKLLDQFFLEYKKDFSGMYFRGFVPCVLTFTNSTSGQQLIEIQKYPKLIELISIINSTLKKMAIKQLEFYLVETTIDDRSKFLRKGEERIDKKGCKILLNHYVDLKQYFPHYNKKSYQDKLETKLATKEIEILIHSFFTFFRQDAINYIIGRLNNLSLNFKKYNEIYPNTEAAEALKILIDKDFPFRKAYSNIAKNYNDKELFELNFSLLNDHTIQTFVPIISKFKSDAILDKFIDLYYHIPVISTKDYDGISAHEIDLLAEEIIIKAICEYDSEKIVPILKKSLLVGKISETKSIAINKLLKYTTKEEILELLPDFNDPNKGFVMALTNQKTNADWVKEFLSKY